MREYVLILTEKDNEGRDKVCLHWDVFNLHAFSMQKIQSSDLDRSYVLEVDSFGPLVDALGSEFEGFDYLQRRHPSLWRRKVGRVNYTKRRMPIEFLPEDESGASIARRMLEFIRQNHVSFGDEGTWQVWSCRDLLLNRFGSNLSSRPQAELKLAVPVKALPDADYTDEFASFRFPSTSCLLGVSQPISQLRGAAKFRQLFIQDGAGVYVAYDDNEVLYVGTTQRFSQRLSNAESHHKLRLVLERHPQALVAIIHYPFWKLPALNDAVTSEEREAAWGRIRMLLFGLERACIEYYQPRYNGTLDEDADTPLCESAPMQFASSRSQSVALAGA